MQARSVISIMTLVYSWMKTRLGISALVFLALYVTLTLSKCRLVCVSEEERRRRTVCHKAVLPWSLFGSCATYLVLGKVGVGRRVDDNLVDVRRASGGIKDFESKLRHHDSTS